MAMIGDYVWYDSDHDAVEDAGEYGAAGVTVTLTGGATAQTAVTDDTGHYDFAVPAGTYTLDFAAPPGYGFSTPSGGETVVSVTSGQTYAAADAGLVPPPNLGGELIVPVKGLDWSGTVAAVAGTDWAAGALSATIQWGDGTSSPGTLVTSGASAFVTGGHTYTHEGDYALAVRVTSPSYPGVRNYAAGLAHVLPATDHRGFEAIDSASASGAAIIGYPTLTAAGGFTILALGTVDYTLSGEGEDASGSFSLAGTGSL
jgi:hypothetical protein